MERFKNFLSSLLLLITVAMAFLAGFLSRPIYDRQKADFPILTQAFQILRDYANFSLPESPGLEYGMIRGMLQAANDPYTSFTEPTQAELDNNMLSGKFGGIGTRMDRDEDGYVRLYPFPDSPAQKAGILDGDRLLEVDDLIITPEITDQDLAAKIRGKVGESVQVVVGTPPEYTPRKYSIKREEFSLPSTSWNLTAEDPRLGMIIVHIIADTTPQEIEQAITELQMQGATHFILDLRNNGGGLLNAGIDTARLFLKDGLVMQQQYRGKDVESYKVEKPGPFTEIPLAVFINQYSASASEIIAGALQIHNRAVLIGTSTYGKNTVQLVFELQDKSSLRVTSARWWIPGSDLPQQGQGLVPDIPLQDVSDAGYINAAIDYFKLNP